MYYFHKKFIFISTLFFSSWLFADGTTIPIYVSDPTVDENETDGTVTFTITLDKAPISILGMNVNYQTRNGSATAGDDYEEKTGGILDFKYFPKGVTSRDVTLDIYDDAIYEGNEGFHLDVSTSASGYQANTTGTATIVDDEPQPLSISIFGKSITETDDNLSSISLRVQLNQNAPMGGVDVNYTTTDYMGTVSDKALAGEDYVAMTSTLHIAENTNVGYIDIPIIGDLKIENIEKFVVKLTSTNKGTLNATQGIASIYDNDFYPEIGFDKLEYSIIEGNSSQQMLNITFLFDEPVSSGASFHYETINGTGTYGAENESTDNDYIYTHGDVNLNVGDTNYTVQIPIIGDTKLEYDEYFKLGISSLNKLSWGNQGEVKINILNDDGSFPTLSCVNSSESILEGDSGTKTITYYFNLDKPSDGTSYFEYDTWDDNSNNGDYIDIPYTPYTIANNETNLSISVTINGDTEEENDESFYLELYGENNLNIDNNCTAIRTTIVNDDTPKYPFTCKEESYLFTSDQTANYSDYYNINMNSGVAIKKQRFGTSHINATGYNVTDNYIYGFEYGDENSNDIEQKYHVVKIDSKMNITRLNIVGLPKTRFYLGDVSLDGIYYLANRNEPDTQSNKLQEIQRVDLNNSILLPKITLQYPVGVSPILGADFAFNPKDNQLYMVNADNNQLIRINRSTGMVEELGDVGNIGNIYSVVSFFDVDGNFYFYTSGTEKIYKIDISNPMSINPIAIEFNDMTGIINSGDGARCANAPITPPILDDTPLVCNDTMYLSSSIKRGTGQTGKMWLHNINTSTNPFSFDVIEENGDAKLYNALAYSDSGDANMTNFIFGLYRDEVLRIGANGHPIHWRNISTPELDLSTTQLFSGAIYDGVYYISGAGVDYDKIFSIDLKDANSTVNSITLSKPISLLDFSFTPDGKFLHGIIDGGELVKVDVTTGTVTVIGSAHSGYQFDSTFSDKNGRFFANDSKGNGFFEFNLNTGAKRFLSASQQASFNDGANCLKEALVFTDYGDAPSSYLEARHNIANGIFLGDEVDHDIEQYYSLDANGDDQNGTDDEDGITLADGSELNGAFFKTNASHTLQVKLSKDAYLNIWIDKDINGVFDNASDLVFNQNLTAGEHNISFNLPAGLQTNQQTYLRARVSSKQNMNPVGLVTDGEVEDYAIKFGTDGIKGDFNIQRTNSALNAKDYNLYTQIVGRDFNYHVVFYDEGFNIEQNLTEVPVKVELFDAIKGTLLYSSYQYFPNIERSRIPVLLPDDLDDLNATKEALFKISYAVNANGDIVQGTGNANCGLNAQNCYESLIASNSKKVVEAKDNFAIRPESYFVKIADANQERVNSREPNPHLSMSAGYEYNLTVFAKRYDDFTPSLGYNKNINASFDFNTTGMTSWVDNSPITEAINLIDGFYNNASFKHNEVGHYSLLIPSDENWTIIDQADGDCIVGSSQISADGNSQSGCNIAQETAPIALTFNPDHFKIDLTLNNLPSTSHDDFIYMTEINSTFNDVAINISGDIIAQTEDNQSTKNFTIGSMAKDVTLELNASTLSVEGLNQQIQTIAGTNVNFTRYILFNNDVNDSNIVNNIVSLGGTLTLTKNKFLDDNNGTATLDIRYNLNKNITEPINPVQVSFNGMKASSPDAKSTAHDIVDNYIPRGNKPFNAIRNFYYARVVSDLNNYPRVNMNISPVVRTPLNVDIYCKTNVANHCANTNVLANTSLSSTTREQNGWYLSSNHNGDVDGNVTTLMPNFTTVSINPDNNITLPNGSNGLPMNTFNDCSNPLITVTIATTPALTFNPSQYTISCTDNNASQWTGIGKTGNVLSIKPKVNGTGKMDW